MIIQHNIMALNSYRQLSTNNKALASNLEKLSSGYKVNRAADDAAGLAVSEKMRAQIKGLQVAQKNAQDGISFIQTAEGALTEVHSMLNRMFELSELSLNGIYDSTDRASYQSEFKALSDEITRISQSTNFNGTTLLDGSLASANAIMQIGDSTNSYDQLAISIADMGAGALSVTGDISTATGASAMMAALKTTTSGVTSGAIVTVATQRAALGALQNRLDHTINNLGVAEENITAAESRIRDTDMAKEMMAYTKNNILLQASQAMLAQANTVPQGILQLLR